MSESLATTRADRPEHCAADRPKRQRRSAAAYLSWLSSRLAEATVAGDAERAATLGEMIAAAVKVAKGKGYVVLPLLDLAATHRPIRAWAFA